MGILREVFGATKADIWTQVANDIGGEFIEGGWFGTDEVRYKSKQWELVLDTHTVSHGKSSTTYTRMRAPFVNKDGLYFKIYPEGILSKVGKYFGMQDIQIGDPLFDDNYIIKGNDEYKIKLLLLCNQIKSLLSEHYEFELEIRNNDDGLFSNAFPQGVEMLYFKCPVVIKDAQKLERVFDLFCVVLDRLVEIDSAYESNPNVTL